MILSLVIAICLVMYATKRFKSEPECYVFTDIDPMDLTVTYCESCKKCTTHQTIECFDFEDMDDDV